MKKLLIKLIPKSLLGIIIKLKYLKYNKKIHQSNIINKKVVKIKYTDSYDSHSLRKVMHKSFGKVKLFGSERFYFHPIAVINVPEIMEIYLKEIGNS